MTKWPPVHWSLRCAEELCHSVTTALCHEAVSAPVSIYLMASVCLYHHCHLINGIAARPPPSCAGGLNQHFSSLHTQSHNTQKLCSEPFIWKVLAKTINLFVLFRLGFVVWVIVVWCVRLLVSMFPPVRGCHYWIIPLRPASMSHYNSISATNWSF